ncbi:MAG: ThiF family adenylyltransferase, partial [Pseudomonadota bacterium]|nr:ThiF family adenylyltransferase [Pseudomonadota bacterium]
MRELNDEQFERYARHLILDEVGEKGQDKLLSARVLCVGAGGLGSPALMYLAAAGVGTIGLIDDDIVDLSNLQRQIIHATSKIGAPKVESARETLSRVNPTIKIQTYKTRLTAGNITEIINEYDVIVDGSDNFETR